MKIKQLLLLFTGMLTSAVMCGQGYYIRKDVGTEAGYDWGQVFSSGTENGILINRPSDDVYSNVAELPFPFTFYGKQVTHYRVCDNGYLTFDTAINTIYTTPGTLPSASGPNNAIYGFWTNLKAKESSAFKFPTMVYNYTYGTAPDRIHVVHWYGLSRADDPAVNNIVSFAIRFHEASGSFDIVFSHPDPVQNYEGTTGCENEDGTMGVAFAGAPATTYPAVASNDNQDNIIYRFVTGTQPEYDVAVTDFRIPKRVHQTIKTTLWGTFRNYGSKEINTITVNYSINGSTPVSHSISAMNIKPDEGTGEFSFPFPLKWGDYPIADNYHVDVWISKINGKNDQYPDNDHLVKTVPYFNGKIVPKNVLVEESTGAWCGYCPEAAFVMDEIEKLHPEYIYVAHHFDDAMAKTKNDIYNSRYGAYPGIFCDRQWRIGGFSRYDWISSVNDYIYEIPLVAVTLTEKTYDPGSGTISFTVNAEVLDSMSGDFRFHAMIVEDKVRGPDEKAQWTQRNYHSKHFGASDTTNPMYHEKYWMEGYYHNHVIREILSEHWGDDNIMPDTVAPGQIYSKTYTYKLDSVGYVNYSTVNKTKYCNTDDLQGNRAINKPEDITLVGFVTNFDEGVFFEVWNDVLNAQKDYLIPRSQAVSATITSDVLVNIYPNPAADILHLHWSADIDIRETDVELYNLQGQLLQPLSTVVKTTDNSIIFDLSLLSEGTYGMRINTNRGPVFKLFNLSR